MLPFAALEPTKPDDLPVIDAFTRGFREILDAISSFVLASCEWVKAFVDCVTSNHLLLAFVIVLFVGFGVLLLKRLVRI